MAFTEPEIVGTFKEAGGAGAAGTITFTLTKRMTNAGVSVVPSTVTATLNSSGELKVKLFSNEDAETVPKDARWRADLRFPVGEVETFYIKVPSGTGPVNIATLLPTQPKGD